MVKTCGKFEFDIYEAKKRLLDSGKACVLKRKVAKMRFFDFSLQYTDFPELGNLEKQISKNIRKFFHVDASPNRSRRTCFIFGGLFQQVSGTSKEPLL